MATENPNRDSGTGAGESSGANTENDDAGVTEPRECHESVDSNTRDEVLADYRDRCQACGRYGPGGGGLATLHVHHIERDPDGMDEHDPENLTLLCRSCHSWFHQQSTPDELPVEISEADESVLLPQDIEILRYLADEGPATTGEVRDALTAELSVTTVRERLALLMGLDNHVASREQQLVDQDRDTGAWGLAGQIEQSARGHIPADMQALVQRVEDEQVRRALERGCDRRDIANVLDISRRTTFHKEKRARAYDFPLDVFRRGGDGGQHPSGGTSGVPNQSVDEAGTATGSSAADSQHDRGAAGEADDEDPGPAGESTQTVHGDTGDETRSSVNTQELREQLETLITRLQQVDGEL